jgi:PadR family transcriptional regulator, regulatory protein PadR
MRFSKCVSAGQREISLTPNVYLYRVLVVHRRQPSPQTVAVLFALSDAPDVWRYGYALCQELNLKAGTLYPILMRLADRGLLETAWEADAPPGRPPRHMYRLTGQGRKAVAELAESGRAKACRIRLKPGMGVAS